MWKIIGLVLCAGAVSAKKIYVPSQQPDTVQMVMDLNVPLEEVLLKPGSLEYGGVAATSSVPQTVYVARHSFRTLQLVVDLAAPGDEIIVAPGRYDFGGRQRNAQGPVIRLVIDKPLRVRSEAGPEETFLVGGPDTRCLYLTNGAEVVGFTITGGETGGHGNKFADLSGGGVWSEPEGLISDCIVKDNSALWFGGGMYGGNAANCEFLNNTARRSGGGVSDARLGNCLVAENRAGHMGGGAHRSELRSCTVARNRAEEFGGGAAYGSAQNSILHHNQSRMGNHNYFETDISYSCSRPTPRGAGNLGCDPGFKNSDAGAFSLLPTSMVIDQGTNNFLLADLDGNPRILDGNNNGHARIDMGAYEYVHPEADSNRDGVPDTEEIRMRSEALDLGRVSAE